MIGGYTNPSGVRRGFGALLVGLHDSTGRLRYAGRVGSGFDEALLDRLALLHELDLGSFVKTTGGKGLHLVVPLERRHGWDEVKAFSRAIADHLARVLPDQFTADMAKTRRTGRIFVDYLRNSEGASAVVAYSARARPGAPVSTPIAWKELSADLRPGDFNVNTIPQRLATLERRGADPWREYDTTRYVLTGTMRRALGLIKCEKITNFGGSNFSRFSAGSPPDTDTRRRSCLMSCSSTTILKPWNG